MTITGQVFKGYAEAIVARHGFGSNKMVSAEKNERRRAIVMRGQRLVDKRTHARNAISILLADAEAAEESGAEGERLWKELAAAENWLVGNGWLRTYGAECSRSRGRRRWTVLVTYYGLTAKGWAVARKYLDAKD